MPSTVATSFEQRDSLHSKYLAHVHTGLPAVLAAVAALTDAVEFHSVQTVSEILELLSSSSVKLQNESDQPYIIGPGIAAFRRWLVLLLERPSAGGTLNPPFKVHTTLDDVESRKAWIVEASRAYVDQGVKARPAIAKAAQSLLRAMRNPGIMVPVCDEVVSGMLVEFAKSKKQFHVYLVQPLYLGSETDAEVYKSLKTAHTSLENSLKEYSIPVTEIAPQTVSSVLLTQRQSIVLTAGLQICGNGSVIALAGTYQTAVVARAHSVPFYVACEAFKMSDAFPLGAGRRDSSSDVPLAAVSPTDVTPHHLISSLIMEKGLVSPTQASGQYVKTWF